MPVKKIAAPTKPTRNPKKPEPVVASVKRKASEVPAPTGQAVETWMIDRLVPYIRNPRKNDAVVDKMAATIKHYGFKIPVLAKSDGTLIDGHLRLKAALKLGLTHVPVILCDEWSDGDVKAFRLLVNRSATWAEWDNEMLSLELDDLGKEFGDLDVMTGFDLSEIEKLTIGAVAPEDWKENWQDMPEFHQEDLLADNHLIINFAGQEQRQAFAVLVGQSLTEKTKSIWYPQVEIEAVKDKRYSGNGTDDAS